MPAPVAASPPSPSPNPKKYSTFAGLRELSGKNGAQSVASNGTSANRTSVRGLFEEDGNLSSAAPSPRSTLAQLSPQTQSTALGKNADGLWSISVAEAKDRREGRKRKPVQASYTLYVTTPTHNLTLIRSAAEIVDLDAKIRDSLTSGPGVPSLPSLPTSSSQNSGRKFFQTISRTLSPSANRNRHTFSNLYGEPNSPSLSESHSANNAASPPPSAPLSPSPDEMAKLSSHSTTTQLATYFTTVSNIAAVRSNKAWIRFVRVGNDDFESVRVERRVRKVRSDLAEHVKSSVAPRNTNVGVAPSQSDLEEDGCRTEDDLESAEEASGAAHAPRKVAKSGRTDSSTEHVQTGSTGDDSRSTHTNIDMIPEERSLEVSEDALTETEGAATAAGQRSRSQRRRAGHNKVTVNDFEMIRVLGKGCAGKVLLVRHSATKGLYAMKSIHKRHVLAHQELQHTLTEQAVLKRMAKEVLDPFVVRLWWSFHDRNNLYLVMDFHPGGDLATQLSRWGRLGRDRARFYAAEIVEGVEGLHKAGVIYRDLKPENVLIGADGHIVLSDFGLSKEFNGRSRSIGSATPPPPTSPGRSHSSSNVPKSRSSHWISASDDGSEAASRSAANRFLEERETTTTFCGTAEYLAPEVLQGQPYSYEVDWWSFGTMLYEMLTGITPFWADTHADMYARVLRDPLVFPEDRVLDQDTKSILRGLLQRNPMLRMKEPRIKKHPYFSMIEWDHIFHKRYIPPYVPPIDPDNEIDTQNFDETFLEMQPTVAHEVDANPDGDAGTDGTADGDEAAAKDVPSAQAASSDAAATADMSLDETQAVEEQSHLFDGYSFRGRKDSDSVKSMVSSPAEREGGSKGVPVDASAGPDDQRISRSVDAASVVATEPGPVLSSDTSATSTTYGPLAGVQHGDIDEEEDDVAAARAAVAALAHLEQEANREASMVNEPSASGLSGQSADVVVRSREATSHATSDSDHSGISQVQSSPASSYSSGVRPAAPSKLTPSATGRPSHGAIREMDNEDDDWDMVELAGPDGELKSEVNGGRGANLFARGVVDTYRLLRRQESTRLPNSNSQSSVSSRSFNRLSKRRNGLGAGSMRLRPSNGNLTSVSAQSLDARSVAERAGDDADVEADSEHPKRSGGRVEPKGAGITILSVPMATSPTPGTTSKEAHRRSAASPSLSGSEENKYHARMKKIKRFTTFFESSSHR
ncbi:kinase-like protein [Testicularia cyperi]|uniref:non-specific serine/threonine protein kinase n=1 Tax=Testicularia cyperi TaxID=1882483 RepID=A0A317XQS4_9BASI|nr:kinase-like protein [Testicularia cyperi]